MADQARAEAGGERAALGRGGRHDVLLPLHGCVDLNRQVGAGHGDGAPAEASSPGASSPPTIDHSRRLFSGRSFGQRWPLRRSGPDLADPRGLARVPGPPCYGSGMTSPFARLALPTLALVFVLAPGDVGAQYRNLCTSIPSACTYTGPDAPVLDATVCFGSAFGIRLMGSSSCPTGSWPYYLDYGEVIDPITNQVTAYIPLDDACDHPGICVDGPPPAGAEPFIMCCTGNQSGSETCAHGASCGGTIYYCEDGVCEPDGTVTCFQAVEV